MPKACGCSAMLAPAIAGRTHRGESGLAISGHRQHTEEAAMFLFPRPIAAALAALTVPALLVVLDALYTVWTS